MSKNTPLVSLIVPIYNVEHYVAECVRSCQNQTMKNIEIICVDDCSTDKSLEIVKQMAKKDSRIKIVTKPKNAGYGNTMNLGFDAAKGEYIGIAESDDYIAPDMCQYLYDRAKMYDLDVIKADYLTFRTKNGKNCTAYEATCIDPKYYNRILVPKNNKIIFDFLMNTWTGIYRADFIRRNNIRHNETPGASYQDNGFWFQTLSLAKSVMFVNRAFYYYRQDNPNSSINSKGKVFCMNDEFKFIHDFVMAHEDVRENFIFEYFRKRVLNYMHTYDRIADEYKLPFLERFSKELHEIQESGEIDYTKLDDEKICSICVRIMDDYELFYYEETVHHLEQELRNAQDRLSRLINSNEMMVGRTNADKLRKLLGKA